MREGSQPWITWFRDALAIGTALAGVLSFLTVVLFAGIFSLYGQAVRTAAQAWLGITEIKSQIADITGATRVTQQPFGMSYVREPVYVGGPIELVLYIGRTEVGAACILREIIPIFTDDNGLTYAGDPRRPSQQLGPEIVRRELVLELPREIPIGRATVALQLEYTCGSVTVYEMTQQTPFIVEEPAASR
jgi:hypothetical protein